jgi:3-hydroxyisobutyrate dehydrogenase-like beta-hydroxyacid dehydrogenase
MAAPSRRSGAAAVAMVGTGRMGAAMAARLAGAGHDLTLYNRTRSRADQLAAEAGGTVAATPAAAAAAADTILVSLADDPAVEAVYDGPEGLIAGLRPGSVVLEMSTVAPETVRGLAPLVAERDATLLDAPVSGSVPVVQRGELTILVGGDEAALAKARPALDSFARNVFHLGALGAGATVKLAVNSIVHALNQAVAEALVLAERAGVDRAAAYEVFAAGAAGAPFVHYKQQAFLHPDTTPVAFSLDLVAKDLELISALADQVGARMDLTTAGRTLVEDALAAGLGNRDLSALAELLRR